MAAAHTWRVLLSSSTLVAALVVLYRTSWCFALEKSRPDYTVYHNLSAVYAEVAALAETYPTYVQVDHRFKSGNGLSQLVVRLANFSDSTLQAAPQFRSYKVRALLLFGQRGGELVTVESALHFLRQLFNGLSAPSHTVEGALIVLVNPDGFNHAERTGDYCFDGTVSGAKMSSLFAWDLDKRLNSEPKTHVLLNLSRAQPYDAFVAFHSGSREIHLPYAGVQPGMFDHKPANLEAMTAFAKEVALAIKPKFVYGQAQHLLNRQLNGTALDFMAGVRKVPFSVSIGLWEGLVSSTRSDCFRQLNPDGALLKETLKELHPLYAAMFLHLIQWKEQQSRHAFSIESDGPSLLVCIAMLSLVVLVMVLFTCQRRLPDSMRFYPRRRVVSLKMLSSSLHSS
uniref:Putative peptidase m14-like domain protein n=1 Tax=Rhipicephalus microplus TaxID=6941 RepID=A0A6M2D657_RHIMP